MTVVSAEAGGPYMLALSVVTLRWSAIDGVLHDILRDRLSSPTHAETFGGLAAGERRFDFFAARIKAASLTPETKDVLCAAITLLDELWRRRSLILQGHHGMQANESAGMSVTHPVDGDEAVFVEDLWNTRTRSTPPRSR